jgi:hypothetical protein
MDGSKRMSAERDRSPEGRFKYLIEKRVPKALKAIDSVSNLSDRKNYSYTQEQADQIVNALESALSDLKTKFSNKPETSERTFKLK